MSGTGDEDADAVIASFAANKSDDKTKPDKAEHATTGDADADAVIASFSKKPDNKASTNLPEKASLPGPAHTDRSPVYDSSKPAIGDSIGDTAHAISSSALHSIIGGYKGIGSLIAAPADFDKASKAVTDEQAKAYQAPDSGLSRAMQSPLNPINYPSQAGQYVGGKIADAGFPGTGALVNAGIQVAPMALGLRRGPPIEDAAPPGGPTAAPAEVGEPVGSHPLAPEVQQQLAAIEAKTTGEPFNKDAAVRHLQAQSLPTPMDLTEGQATQNGAKIADEFNRRATPEGAAIADRMNQHNGQLIKNINQIRDKAAPDAALRTTDEHAQTLMDAYEADKERATADISAKYKALTDANGGDFPIDGKQLVANIDAALKQKLKTGHLSPGLASALNEFRDGSRPMNFEDFETLRTDAAADMRSGGNPAAAAGIIRKEAEKLPLTGDAAKLKPIADEARAAARAQFEKEDADPAYKAVVEGKAKSNTFFNKYVLNAPREHVEILKNNISNPDVEQALVGGTTNFLKQRAGITGESSGNFGQAGYNRALESQRAKLDLLADPETVNHLNTLGDVSRYTQFQPRGYVFNNSGTEVLRQGEVRKAMGGMAAGAAEHAANAAAMSHGIPIAAGSIIRKVAGASREQKALAAESAARRAATENALRPGAGIGGGVSLEDLKLRKGGPTK